MLPYPSGTDMDMCANYSIEDACAPDMWMRMEEIVPIHGCYWTLAARLKMQRNSQEQHIAAMKWISLPTLAT